MSKELEKSGSEFILVENFIDGVFTEGKEYLDSFNPSTGKVWAKIPNSSADEVNDAVSAARKAFPGFVYNFKILYLRNKMHPKPIYFLVAGLKLPPAQGPKYFSRLQTLLIKIWMNLLQLNQWIKENQLLFQKEWIFQEQL